MNRELEGAYVDHDHRRRIQVMTFGEFKELAKKNDRYIYPYLFNELPDTVLGIIDGLTFTILDFSYKAEKAIEENKPISVMSTKKIMCFPNTGLGNEEFSYIETDKPSVCMECSFRHNSMAVAPCFDCVGYHQTGRSYFQEKGSVTL